MLRRVNEPKGRRDGERGTIMVMTAIMMLGLVLSVGLCIDVSRIYMVRTEMQNAADAAALAAARELNSGAQGIADAAARATAIVNTQGFDKADVSIAEVEFAVNLNGDYTSKQAFDAMGAEAQQDFAKDVRFVRVTTQTTAVSILFAARALGGTHPETAGATAGMSVGLNTICDFFPIAAALTPENQAALTEGQFITLNFADGITGSSAAVPDHTYAVIQVPDINGTGNVETIKLAAGVSDICASLGSTQTLDSSMSSNPGNGRDAIAKGANTRFDDPNSYKGAGALDPTLHPPDLNVREGLTASEYLAGSPSTPPPTNPGAEDRRILIMPIIEPLPAGSSPTIEINKFGAFLLRNKVAGGKKCDEDKTKWCGGDMELAYLGTDFVIGRGSYDPSGGTTNLTVAVLYK